MLIKKNSCLMCPHPPSWDRPAACPWRRRPCGDVVHVNRVHCAHAGMAVSALLYTSRMNPGAESSALSKSLSTYTLEFEPFITVPHVQKGHQRRIRAAPSWIKSPTASGCSGGASGSSPAAPSQLVVHNHHDGHRRLFALPHDSPHRAQLPVAPASRTPRKTARTSSVMARKGNASQKQ